MATVIDELLITLGLDSRQFKTQAQQTQATINQVGTSAVSQSKQLEEGLRKHQEATVGRLKQVEQVGHQTYQQFNRLRLEVMALFSTLATGYGIQKFIKDMTSSEASVGRLSKAIGNISTEDLAAFEQAAERMGGNADATGQSILGLSQEIEKLSVTGDSAIRPFLNAMHVNIADPITGRLRDMRDILGDIGKWMSTHQGADANFMGRSLGFDQGLINLLSSGKVDEFLAKVRQIGVTNEEDAKKGQEFIETLHDFEQTIYRLGQVIANDYLKDINQVIRGMTDWTLANREWLKADIEQKITAAVGYVKDFLAAVREVVDAVGGWKNATEIVFGIWVLAKVAPILSAISAITTVMTGLRLETVAVGSAFGLMPGLIGAAAAASTLLLSGDTPGGGERHPRLGEAEMDERIQKYNREHPDNPIESFSGMMNRLWQGTRRFLGMPSGATDERQAAVRDQLSQRLQISPDAASGIVSNLNAESGIQGINEVNPAVPGSRGGFGWAQWTGPRRDEFEAYAARHHLDPAADETNMGFLVEELSTKYPQILAQLRRGGISAREAADIVARGYIVPPADKIEGHVADAQRVARIPAGGDIATKPTMTFPAQPAAPLIGQAPSAPPPPPLLTLPGAPASTPDFQITPPGQLTSLDPALLRSAQTPAAASFVSNDNSRAVSNSNETNIGAINIQTTGGDPDSIARGVGASLRKYAFVSQANFGLA